MFYILMACTSHHGDSHVLSGTNPILPSMHLEIGQSMPIPGHKE